LSSSSLMMGSRNCGRLPRTRLNSFLEDVI